MRLPSVVAESGVQRPASQSAHPPLAAATENHGQEPLRPVAHQRGFILALGLLLLAALAMLGTAVLSSASFQNDMANNLRENQESYYVAGVGLSEALSQMLRNNPGNVRTRDTGNPYLVGYFDRATGDFKTVNAVTAGDRDKLCKVVGEARCYDFFVDVLLQRCGHAQMSSVDKYVTLHYRIRSTATGFHGNSSTVTLDVAGTYPGYCP